MQRNDSTRKGGHHATVPHASSREPVRCGIWTGSVAHQTTTHTASNCPRAASFEKGYAGRHENQCAVLYETTDAERFCHKLVTPCVANVSKVYKVMHACCRDNDRM